MAKPFEFILHIASIGSRLLPGQRSSKEGWFPNRPPFQMVFQTIHHARGENGGDWNRLWLRGRFRNHPSLLLLRFELLGYSQV